MPENVGSAEKLEEAMCLMKIQNVEDHNGGPGHSSSPDSDRPGGPDCVHYLKTGVCGYGSNCRFNHPSEPGQIVQNVVELPERVGQPDCQFFLKTGTCKFGSYCKYHHPQDKKNGEQVQLNIIGLPMRKEEKPCPYYMRNGSCKFGVACKFHHPQPQPVGAPSPLSGTNTAYGSFASPMAAQSGLPYSGGLHMWSVPRAPPYISGPRMQGPQGYVPMVISPPQGILPAQQGWNTYTGIMGSAMPNTVLGSNLLYNSQSPGDLGSGEQAQLLPTSIPSFPERPDQPECQYYMRNGSCKFGSNCKYHHPKERIVSAAPNALSAFGLPLRPGHPICTFYGAHGFCKFGSACKYDHPFTGIYNYGMSIPALPPIHDPHMYHYRRNPSETGFPKPSRVPDKTKKIVPMRSKHLNLDTKVPKDPEEQQGEQPPSSTSTPPTSPKP
ncbi:hypothetical protein Syun_026897 [Stephania yunnanensis]|uniref:C3H1-type domain-containing protein n=1 Tax=Stephania yunnanensis TaxID=152371 RepID=A0AAP0EEM4_9MAGN